MSAWFTQLRSGIFKSPFYYFFLLSHLYLNIIIQKDIRLFAKKTYEKIFQNWKPGSISILMVLRVTKAGFTYDTLYYCSSYSVLTLLMLVQLVTLLSTLDFFPSLPRPSNTEWFESSRSVASFFRAAKPRRPGGNLTVIVTRLETNWADELFLFHVPKREREKKERAGL